MAHEPEPRIELIRRRVDAVRQVGGYVFLLWIAIIWVVAASGLVRLGGMAFLACWIGLGVFWTTRWLRRG